VQSWELIKDIVGSALELDCEHRYSYAAERCSGNAELLAEVVRLIESAEIGGTFLEHGPIRKGAKSTAAFADGELLCGRFRILRWVGSGGMGDVYWAFDEVLRVTVALKTIRSDIAVDERLVNRLRKEVQLAREVTHPNVCRIHDLFHHRVTASPGEPEGEVQFLSMEFLPGETLAERLRREGSPPFDAAVRILLQIAEGLSAAHRAGVVHRDLKPGNIMLIPTATREERVVVTDFGLARRTLGIDESQVSVTSLAGTPAYMAPEQLAGGRATFECDVYAFGVIAYQLLAGCHPSDPDSAGGGPRTTQRPGDPLSGIDPLWKRVILRCLERSPARRFPSAEQVLLELLPERAVRDKRPLTAKHWLAGVTLVLALAVALFVTLTRFHQWRSNIAKGSRVLLTEIRAPDPELEGVTTVLRSQLAQSPQFVLMDDARVNDLLQQMAVPRRERLDGSTAREVALRGGAPLIIYGSLSVLGQEYVLSIKMEQVSGTPFFARNTWKAEFPAANKNGLFEVVHRAANWIRTTAGEATQDLAEQDRRPEDTTTSSWQALQLYRRARHRSAEGQGETAILLLREAIQLDPDFAIAYAELADRLISIKRYDEGYEAWRQALTLTKQRQLTSRESLRIRGQYFEDTGDYAAAERTYRTFVVHYPNDYMPAFFLASVLDNLGRTDEAITHFNQVCLQWPDEYSAAVHLAWLYLTQNRFNDAAMATAKVQAMDRDWARWLGTLSLFAQGHTEQALAAAVALGRSPSEFWRSRSYLIRACLLAELDRIEEGIAEMRQGIAFDSSHGIREAAADKHLLLAQLYLRQKAAAAAREECTSALALDSTPRRAARSGMLLAQAGYVNEAHRILDELGTHTDVPRLVAARHRLAGEIALAQGAPKRGLREFRQAAAMSPAGECWEQIARALEANGDRSEAIAAYKEIAEAPAKFWPGPQTDVPGLHTECRRKYAQLSNSPKKSE
jgi:serine/threonine protein kinase/tetratricopeptide (TPR) repeat protein